MRYTLLLLVLSAGLLSAQTAEKRLALVIGNSGYVASPLTNPINDARSIAAVLRRAGFEVTEKYDLNIVGFNNAVTDFTRQFMGDNIVALFYYAGHGIQDQGENYLVPIDADSLADDQITYRCVPLKRITAKMRAANNYTNILILDACRQYPLLGDSRSLQGGLAQFEDGLQESLVAYATAPGRIARDQREQVNGLFTGYLLKHIETPGQEINELFFEVRKGVKEQSGDQQIPSVTNNLTHKFYFFAAAKPVPSVTPDTDKDGVPDADDRCPTDPGPARLQGCPESNNHRMVDGESGKKEPDGWVNCLGISYSTFTSDDAGLETIKCHAVQANYILVNRLGGYVSLGGYTGLSSGDYNISIYKVGAIGAGARFLNLSSGLKAYLFAGAMYFHNNSDSGVFGGVKNFYGYEVFLAGNLQDVGLKAGYVSGIKNGKGFSVGLHYCF